MTDFTRRTPETHRAIADLMPSECRAIIARLERDRVEISPEAREAFAKNLPTDAVSTDVDDDKHCPPCQFGPGGDFVRDYTPTPSFDGRMLAISLAVIAVLAYLVFTWNGGAL